MLVFSKTNVFHQYQIVVALVVRVERALVLTMFDIKGEENKIAQEQRLFMWPFQIKLLYRYILFLVFFKVVNYSEAVLLLW